MALYEPINVKMARILRSKFAINGALVIKKIVRKFINNKLSHSPKSEFGKQRFLIRKFVSKRKQHTRFAEKFVKVASQFHSS